MRSKILGAMSIVLVAATALAAPAGAVVANTAHGRVSYLPLNGAATGHSAMPIRSSTVPSGKPPLEYHGGPVMHSQIAYAIFWAPSGFAFPSGYTSAIEGFLEGVATDSGKPSNVYSVSAQYTDETGHAAYDDSFGGSIEDTHAYPTSGTCPTYKGFSESFTACISDSKLEAEVDTVVDAQKWPRGLGAEYYVVLPPHVGSCFDVAGKTCFDKQFCAYHSYTTSSPEAIYANISYSPGDVLGCGVGEYPNGHANGNVDDTLSSLSHEANESITDPTLEAWYDKAGFEDGDECRNTPFEEDFGAPLGGSAGALFNQAIGGDHYYLQQEWSNDTEDCAQRVDPPTPQIADPGQLVTGQQASFDGSGSSSGSGGIASFKWDFGDGGTASGPKPTHTFQTSGTFTVTLTLEDDGDFPFSTTRQVSVVTPVPKLSLTIVKAGTGTGRVESTSPASPKIVCGTECEKKFEEGKVVVLKQEASPGSVFAEWGGACSDTDTCEVTMSAAKEVTATFNLAVTPEKISSTPTVVSVEHLPITEKQVKCRKGFRKAKRHGKTVCVKVRKRHRSHHR